MSVFPELPLEVGLFDWIEASGKPPAEIFEHKLQMAQAAEAVGFYAWQIAEHQGTPLSLNVSPSLLLAAAAQRTERIRMGALVFNLPWYSPFRFYNEICVLDQLTRGRLELGVGRGVSPIESRIYGLTSVEESRGRYREALDIFFLACRSRGLTHHGEYYHYEDVDLYNRPWQEPYPPLWFPSSNRESIGFTAAHGYHTCLNVFAAAEVRDLFQQYREEWVAHKDDPGRHNDHVAAPRLGTTHHVVVAETDGVAMELARPAHAVWAGHIGYLNRKQAQAPLLRDLDFESRQAKGLIVVGSPSTVRDRLQEMARESTVNYLLLTFSFGDLDHDAALRSLQLFGAEVLPALRGSRSPASVS